MSRATIVIDTLAASVEVSAEYMQSLQMGRAAEMTDAMLIAMLLGPTIRELMVLPLDVLQRRLLDRMMIDGSL